jgi:hypothetical protein
MGRWSEKEKEEEALLIERLVKWWGTETEGVVRGWLEREMGRRKRSMREDQE